MNLIHIQLGEGLRCLLNTKFGWTMLGAFGNTKRKRKLNSFCCLTVSKQEQRSLQRIPSQKGSSDPISTYNLNTVAYETPSTSHLAVHRLFKLADKYK